MQGFHPHKAKGRKNYANGGRIYGPGTGTSDDIEARVPDGSYIMPADSVETLGEREMARHGAGTGVVRGKGFKPGIAVNLSNGEHALSPEQVQEIGAATLEVVRGATHTPAGPRGFKPDRVDEALDPEDPPMFFAEGGQVTEEERRRRLLLEQIPAGGPEFTPPAAAPAAEAPRFMDNTRNVLEQSSAERNRLAAAGDGFGASGEALRGAAALVPAVAQDVFGEPLRLAGNAATGLARGASQFLTGSTGQAPAPTVPTPAMTTPSTTAGVGAPPVADMEASRRSVAGAPMGTQPGNTAPAMNPGDAGAVTRVGNSYTGGPNVSGDITVNGAEPRGGAVSPQNQAAAEALVARGFNPAAAAAATGAPGVTAPVVRNSTNDWASRNDLRNAATAASSIMVNGGQWDKTGPGDSAEVTAYKAALSGDAAARTANAASGQEGLRQNAALQREGIQQDGANQRATVGATNDARRLGIDASRANTEARSVDSQIEARGFGNRALAQQERLRNTISDPAASPAQRQQAQQALQALSARPDQPKFTVVPGGQEWDAAAGAMRNVPARVISNQTGQFIDPPGATATPSGVPNGVAQPQNKAEYDALPKGAQYTKNGITYTKS